MERRTGRGKPETLVLRMKGPQSSPGPAPLGFVHLAISFPNPGPAPLAIYVLMSTVLEQPLALGSSSGWTALPGTDPKLSLKSHPVW